MKEASFHNIDQVKYIDFDVKKKKKIKLSKYFFFYIYHSLLCTRKLDLVSRKLIYTTYTLKGMLSFKFSQVPQ